MFKPLALVTGAIGFGLSRNVRELYAFLCRNYESPATASMALVSAAGPSLSAFSRVSSLR